MPTAVTQMHALDAMDFCALLEQGTSSVAVLQALPDVGAGKSGALDAERRAPGEHGAHGRGRRRCVDPEGENWRRSRRRRMRRSS